MKSLFRPAAVLAALCSALAVAVPAHAAEYRFGTVAMLDVRNGADGDLLFDLRAPGLDSYGASSFLGALAVAGMRSGFIVSVTGDAPVSLASGGGPGGEYGFRFDLTGPGRNRLTDNESVQWTWAGSGYRADGLTLAAHIQGGSTAGGSAWVNATPTPPVPEPATWALMFGGLGVVAGVARRRRRTAA